MSSPAQRLDSDALSCALAFLSLAELLTVAQSCRSWFACASAMPSIHAALDFGWPCDPEKRVPEPSEANRADEKADQSKPHPQEGPLAPRGSMASTAVRIADLSRSRLRKHVSSIGCPVRGLSSDELELVPLRMESIALLSRLPSLRWLDVRCINAGHGVGGDLRMPASLTYLRINTSLDTNDASSILSGVSSVCIMNLLLRAAGHCGRLRTIHLECESPQPEAIDLSPLLQLSGSLTSLELDFSLNLTQMRVVLALVELRVLRCDTTVLPPLEPHRLRHLHTLDCNRQELSVADLEFLASLPSLTRFPNQWKWEFAALPLLRRLQLRVLKLGPIYRPDRHRGDADFHKISAAELLDVLTPCAMMKTLERLDLTAVHDLLSDDDAAALFTPCAHLRVLCLSDVRVQSLQFLLLLPALRQLSIWGCTDTLTPDDLAVLLSLVKLERLHLDEEHRAEPRWIPADVLAWLSTLPSALLPHLRCFQYEASVNGTQPACRIQIPNQVCQTESERLSMDMAERAASRQGCELPSDESLCFLPSYCS